MAALAGPSQSIFTKCPLCGALQAVPVIEAMVRKGRAQEGGVSAGSVGEEALSRVLKGDAELSSEEREETPDSRQGQG